MAKSSTPVRKAWRSLGWLAAIIAVMAGLLTAGNIFWGWQWVPKLALDLEGGTRVVLAPQVGEGQTVSQDQLNQAVSIIRDRVDFGGVSESEINTEGSNIEVLLPGVIDKETLDRLQQSSKMEFRAVILAGTPSPDTSGETPSPTDSATPTPTPTPTPTTDPTPNPTPTDGSDPNWVTPELQTAFDSFECNDDTQAAAVTAPADEPLIVCDDTRSIKYLLGPVEVAGDQITDAFSGQQQGNQGVNTGIWAVNIRFTAEGGQAFKDVGNRIIGLDSPRNQFAAVYDGQVITAPRVQGVTDQPSITGSFTQETATALANQLKFGALPVSFVVQTRDTVSPTLGASQLQSGILAGLIGLILVVIYSFFQYRALASVTIASIIIAAALTYLFITIISWRTGTSFANYRLSLAGVAGLIVAIGFTVDSFIVYFERVRDELRDGRGLVGAVEAGWKRALRTIYAAKGVNLLSAVVLGIIAVGSVKGFAFTLGITVVIDVLVVVLFTHPMLQLLANTRFFSSGHPLSGLDPDALGAVYRGRAEFRVSTEARRAGASREAGRRQTIAERKAAELSAPAASEPTPKASKPASKPGSKKKGKR